MGYDTEFTDENKSLLEDTAGGIFYNTTLTNTSGNGISRNIEWGQVLRCGPFNDCKEEYKECDYKLSSPKTKIEEKLLIKVFIASECGQPPSILNTNGMHMGGGKLHFGYVYIRTGEDQNIASMFFVIHPNSWGPYQKRFLTSGITEVLDTFIFIGGQAVGVGTGAVGGVATGAIIGSIFPGVGTVVGGLAGGLIGGVGGAAAGTIVDNVADDLLGQYLRYIG